MRFFLVLALCAVAANGAATYNSLNALLGVEGLIPYQTRTDDHLGQLRELVNHPDALAYIYSQYKALFNVNRDNIDFFGKKLLTIAEHNLRYAAGEETWEKGVNQFSDLTEEEFLRQYTGLVVPENVDDDYKGPTLTSPTLTAPEDSVNWTDSGIVTPVKDQKSCGSCVTFATCAVIESAFAKKNSSNQLDLSEQELLDCTKDNNGCQGGWYDPAFKEVQKYGLASEQDYSYINRQNGFWGFGSCQRTKDKKKNRAITTISNWGTCVSTKGDEEQLRQAVASRGPVAVAVAANKNFQDYKSGVFNQACDKRVTHAVTVTGYGTDESGGPFWSVKNSWGVGWGEAGYIRITRGSNHCLIADHCYYVEA